MMKIKTSVPYIAARAPRSPLVIAVSGAVVALLIILAGRLGVSLPPEESLTVAVSSIIMAGIALLQRHLAAKEQRTGAALLEAAIRAPVPSTPEALATTIALLQESARNQKVRPEVQAWLDSVHPQFLDDAGAEIKLERNRG